MLWLAALLGGCSVGDTEHNISPTANAGENFTLNTGQTSFLLKGSASDPDGRIVSYQWEQISGPTAFLSGEDTDSLEVNFIADDTATSMVLRFTVVDDKGASASDNVTVSWSTSTKPTTCAPDPTAALVVNAGADQDVVAGERIDLKAAIIRSQGDIVNARWLRIQGNDIGGTLNGADTLEAWFIAKLLGSDPEERVFEVAVEDAAGNVAADCVRVRISPSASSLTPVNTPPTANAGADQSVGQGDAVQLSGTAFDADGDALSFQWSQVSGPFVTLVNADGLKAGFTAPQVSAVTPVTLQLRVDDGRGGVSSDQMVVTVNPATNTLPTVNAGVDQSVEQGDTVQLSGSASDADGDALSFQWTQVAGPAVTLLDGNSLNASFSAPVVSAIAPVTLQLSVDDGNGGVVSDQVVVSINPASNIPPDVNAGVDKSVDEGVTVTLSGTATDSDGSIASQLWTQTGAAGAPTVTLLNPETLSPSFVAPTVSSVTVLTFALKVTDNLGASSTDEVQVTVIPNKPPVADAGTDQSVIIGETVALSGSGNDSDGSIVTWLWEQVNGPSVSIVNAGSQLAGFAAPSVSVSTALTFQLTVTDNDGATDSDQVVVTVLPNVTLSGTVSSAPGSVTDSDLNDPNAPYASNDTLTTAQVINNPVLIGGYANRPGQGSAGRSRTAGDVDDYYFVPLSSNQIITLYISDAGTGNDLDLYLYNDQGTQIAASVGPGNATESVTVTTAGNYFIQVTAFTGASGYVLGIEDTATTAAVSGWTTQSEFMPGEAIVKYKNSGAITAASAVPSNAAGLGAGRSAGASALQRLAGASDRVSLMQIPAATGLNIASASIAAAPASVTVKQKLDTLLAIKNLAQSPDVASASPNYILHPAATVPNDSNYLLQWYLPYIKMPQAWDISTGSSGVTVAVIDGGILPAHPDFAGKLVPGYDFVLSDTSSADGQPGIDPDPTDPGDGGGTARSGFHGTHVAGIIAAATNNNTGVAGIGWNVSVMPLRAIGVANGTLYDLEQAVLYAAGLPNDSGTVPTRPADVINLSVAGPATSTNPPQPFVDARNAGVIIVAAAGNNGTNELVSPASYNGVVSVSAVTSVDARASYSNYGPTVDIAAPGGNSGDLDLDGITDTILSTGANDTVTPLQYIYTAKMGTSMATPVIAGVAALMKSVYPALTPAEFDAMLANGDLTDDLGPTGRDDDFGYGLVNAQKALQAAASAGGVLPAVLVVNPTSFDFGVGLAQAQLTISNGGGGSLSVTGVTEDSGGWLNVSANSVDSNGVGSYTVRVNRSALGAGDYAATITVNSDAGNASAAVVMRVVNASSNDNAGYQTINLLDAATQNVVKSINAGVANGQYIYSFTDVAPGTYRINAGSDSDHDGIICEVGDACGAYPLLSGDSDINVDGSTINLDNLNFETGYHTSAVTP